MTRIAFFDLDRTVLEVNSAALWVRREVRLGHLRRSQALRAALWVGLYGLGMTGIERALRRAVTTLAGQAERGVRERTEAFWHEEVQHRIRPGARRCIEQHRREGHRIVLLTSSSSYLAELAVTHLGLDGQLSNRLETRDGFFTGDLCLPLCYGAGKVHHAAALAEASGAQLAACSFYSDSYSDLPMFEAVGFPVAVHPDPRLGRHARRRSWPVDYWSPTS